MTIYINHFFADSSMLTKNQAIEAAVEIVGEDLKHRIRKVTDNPEDEDLRGACIPKTSNNHWYILYDPSQRDKGVIIISKSTGKFLGIASKPVNGGSYDR